MAKPVSPVTGLADSRRTRPLGFHSKKSQLGRRVQEAEIGFLPRVRSTHCKDTSHTGRCHTARGRGGWKGAAGDCAGWEGAAGAAERGAELREASGKSPDKDRSMLERSRRHVYMLGSDKEQVKGLGVPLGPSAASHPADIEFAGRRCRVCHLVGLERAGGDPEWKVG